MTSHHFMRNPFASPRNLHNLLHHQDPSDSSVSDSPSRQQIPDDLLLSPVSSHNSTGFSAASSGALYSHCIGKPRTLISSHSGTITLALSLQEPCVFLTCCPPGASSYRDLGVDAAHESPIAGGGGGGGGANGTGSDRDSEASSRPTPARQTPIQPDDLRGLSELPPATLRGSVLLKLTKPTKIKQLTLSFFGVSKTTWSQSSKMHMLDATPDQTIAEVHDTMYINSHDWEFLPEQCPSSESLEQSISTVITDIYGADAAILRSHPDTVLAKDPAKTELRHNHACRTISDSTNMIPLFAPSVTPKRRLRHPSTAHKDAVLMPAGEYVYNFTLAIDANTPETLKAPHGSISYYLMPKVVRAGPFALNLTGQQEIEIVRSPPNNYDSSFNNPVVISRTWDNRLHYEIVIPQKYVPLGTSIPMAIKLTPLEKVKVHRVRVQIYETIQYRYSTEPYLEFSDCALKLLLYEKKAKPVPGEIQTKGKLGGNLLKPPPSDSDEASTTHIDCTLPLLSDDSSWEHVPAQYFKSVQSDVQCLRPDAISSPYIRVRHRLVVAFRISKQDPGDEKRRHFEVKIDTPINFLSKRCVHETVDLPRYNLDDFHAGAQSSSGLSQPMSYLPSFDDALAAVTHDELFHTHVPSPPPEYSTIAFDGRDSSDNASMTSGTAIRQSAVLVSRQ
jgi:hypothetical protein